jgi:lactate dehydrogenase-like 2-hydroxyacid dehydrogenase
LTELGIALYHTPDVLTDAVAVHTMCFITALASNVPRSNEWVKSGRWATDGFSAAQAALRTTDLFNMTIGIVGMGRIGREVLFLLAPYGPNILWTDIDPSVQARAGELDEKYRSLAGARGYAPIVKCVSLDELLAGSDLVSAHMDLNPTSRNLFSSENLSKMKQGAYFVNTARGGVADYEALYDRLATGRLAGAALDVFSEEPPRDEDRQKLLRLPNVLTTPHTASDRTQTRLSMWYLAAYSLLARLLGYKPTNIANPDVYP